jgi:stage II sporulation protein R
MKKILYILSIIFILFLYINITNTKTLNEDTIRFRIIANSNTYEDQQLKRVIKKDLELNLFPLLENSNSVIETKQTIEDNLPTIETLLSKYNVEYNINLGKNYFPAKEYDNYIYDEGYYESLVIELGEANGNNWWCVMYPPLCLIESNNEEDIEYKLYIDEILHK